MSRRNSGRLVLPGEDEGQRIPAPLKAILFAFIVVVVVGVLFNECSVPEANAQGALDRYRHEHLELELRRKEVKALESIARSLKEIAGELRRGR